ncbi:major histocompatibility complex class I-related gene protein-like [Pagrus major]|uniref:major histocompatibility complex class I-related gene protein-like n=1 Tax=Pagrus major TaxID=143350 RepID=UPI003CC8A80B
MKMLFLLALLGTGQHDAAAVTHSLKYFYTGSSGVPNFPEFVVVGLVNEVEMVHYDSNTKKAEPKQDWMSRAIVDDHQYWERQTQVLMGEQQSFKANIDILKPRFNQTGGVHVYQEMYGCEWDDETKEVNGFDQWGYDGEDFVAFDLKTETYIAPTPQAFITKQKWDHDKAQTAVYKQYFTQDCVDWLKKYVDYGRSSLLRTELPSVSLLQKTPCSPVSCHATGFYPDRASLVWRKDGVELHEEVDHGEILPNHDGTFQMSVDLNLSSVKPEDWKKYDCVFQLAGVNEDKITRLDKAVIRTNEGKPIDTTIIIISAAVAVLALVLIAAIGFSAYKMKKAKCAKPDVSSKISSTGSTHTESLMKESDTLSMSSDESSTGSLNSNSPLIEELSQGVKKMGNCSP